MLRLSTMGYQTYVCGGNREGCRIPPKTRDRSVKSLELARIALITFIVITLLAIVQTVTFGDEAVTKANPKSSDVEETHTLTLGSDRVATTDSSSTTLLPYTKVLEGPTPRPT